MRRREQLSSRNRREHCEFRVLWDDRLVKCILAIDGDQHTRHRLLKIGIIIRYLILQALYGEIGRDIQLQRLRARAVTQGCKKQEFYAVHIFLYPEAVCSGSLIDDIARVDGARRFHQQDVTFLFGNGPVLYAF